MTRINVIPVEELSDQHLMAEYRELPRAIKSHNGIDGRNVKNLNVLKTIVDIHLFLL